MFIFILLFFLSFSKKKYIFFERRFKSTRLLSRYSGVIRSHLWHRSNQEVINTAEVVCDRLLLWLSVCRPHAESTGWVWPNLKQRNGQSSLLCRLVLTRSTSSVYTVGAFIWSTDYMTDVLYAAGCN